MIEFLQKAKEASGIIGNLDTKTKNNLLNTIADMLVVNAPMIISGNKIDIKNAKDNNLSSALVDRLFLDEERIEGMATALREIAALTEPVGKVIDGWITEDNLKIEKVSVPIGVIGVIYESRPNVTSDVAGLCIKSGNVAILKGGKEAQNSNEAIAKIIGEAIESQGLPKEMVSLLPDSSREGVNFLIKQDKYVDLIIPRGGETLIRHVSKNASVPVVKHDKGLCHTYVDIDADLDDAVEISLNAKTQRPGVCNAMETMLVHKDIAHDFIPKIVKELEEKGTELRGCTTTTTIANVTLANEEDWDTEYLANILSIKVVEDVKEAVKHVNKYGSGHSECIVTKNYENGETFLNEVDAACVYINASTRFTDGGAFGFGAEVGISTNKLHSRGPMGINDLTTYKFKIYGHGQIRG
ncbi:MAG: glutamate-5-semialdehyde dehydrogenase [Campylobacterales bacterium]|nr:glutamate-5-semialdehyde dehydrogenase [Campylobacterales bacterium]